jgi:hypothetical protein
VVAVVVCISLPVLLVLEVMAVELRVHPQHREQVEQVLPIQVVVAVVVVTLL